jgi:hypothetical protein
LSEVLCFSEEFYYYFHNSLCFLPSFTQITKYMAVSKTVSDKLHRNSHSLTQAHRPLTSFFTLIFSKWSYLMWKFHNVSTPGERKWFYLGLQEYMNDIVLTFSTIQKHSNFIFSPIIFCSISLSNLGHTHLLYIPIVPSNKQRPARPILALYQESPLMCSLCLS